MKSIYFKNPDGLYSSGNRGGIEKITKIMELI
jgi:hypothetical protein